MRLHLLSGLLAILTAALAAGAQAPPGNGGGEAKKEAVGTKQEAVGREEKKPEPLVSVPAADRPAGGAIENQKSKIENPDLDRRRADFELRRRQAQLDRCRERLARYQKELANLGETPRPPAAEPDEPPDAPVAIGRLTDRDGRTVYAIEAARATLQAVLEALATEARVDLLVDQGVSVRDLSACLSVALDGVTLRQALDLVLGGFDLDFTLGDGQLVVTLASKGPYRTAEERLRQRAEQTYRAALVEFPNSSHAPRAHLTLGQYLQSRGLHPQAVEELKRLVHDYPRSEQVPAALAALGTSYQALGDAKNAAAAHHGIVASHADSPFVGDSLLALARGCAAQDPGKAAALLEELLTRRPERRLRLEAELLLAECHLAAGRHAAALARLDGLLAEDPPGEIERRVRLAAARGLLDAGDCAKARAAFYHLAGKFPGTPEGVEARYLLAETYFREKAHLAAVEAYRGALASLPKAPQAAEATFRLAQLYQQMTLYDLSIATCERLLAEGSERVKGREGEAPAELPSAAKSGSAGASPSRAPTPLRGVTRRALYETIGECCADRGDLLKAQHSFERAAEGARDPAAWRDLLRAAEAALADRRPADALPLAQRVADQATDKGLVAQALHAAGDCHRQLGRPDAALAAYRRAAEATAPPEAEKK